MRQSLMQFAIKRSPTISNKLPKKARYAQARASRQTQSLHWHGWGTPKTSPQQTGIRPQQSPASGVTAFCLALLGLGLCQSGNPLALEAGNGGQQPLSHDVRDLTGWVPYTMEDVEEYLRIRELFAEGQPSSGLLRVDVTQLESNSPLEDTISHHVTITDSGGKASVTLGVFDGHWGVECAYTLREFLYIYVSQAIDEAWRRLNPDSQSTEPARELTSSEIDQAIKNAFLRLDRDIIEGAATAIEEDRFLNDAMSEVAPTYSGSCALFSLYDPQKQILKVACTGDSRAVLGRRNAQGGWEAMALSVDQTGYNRDEIVRIHAEHPGEPDIIRDGRLLGMAVTRAFGDGIYKWSKEISEKAKERYFGRHPRPGSETPPYMTAEPEITTTKIYPENGDFVIMASDGLWDQLTNKQAVDLVGRWLESHDPSTLPLPPAPLPFRDNAQIVHDARRESRQRGKPPTQAAYTKLNYIDEKNFVIKDDNAATHLARNALGGGNEDLLRGLLTVPPPFSRNLRDDITVQVVFFGNKEETSDDTPDGSQTFDLDNTE